MCLSNRPNILLVTECNLFQKVVEKLLSKEYQLLVAKTFQEAFAAYSQEEIDLGVFDISTHDEDGFAMCQSWRSLPRYEQLPMIVLTSRFSKIGQQEEDLAYLKQPVQLSDLRKMVKKLLKLKYQNQCYDHKIFVEAANEFISAGDSLRLEYI